MGFGVVNNQVQLYYLLLSCKRSNNLNVSLTDDLSSHWCVKNNSFIKVVDLSGFVAEITAENKALTLSLSLSKYFLISFDSIKKFIYSLALLTIICSSVPSCSIASIKIVSIAPSLSNGMIISVTTARQPPLPTKQLQ